MLAPLKCRYVMSDGSECGQEIRWDAESKSGYIHTEGHDWCHWASPRRYGPQDSGAAFITEEERKNHVPDL